MDMSSLQLLDVPRVAALCSVRPATVRAWIARGTLPALRIGRHYRVAASALARLQSRASLPVAPAQRAGARAWPANRLGGPETAHTGGRRETVDTAPGGSPAGGSGRQRQAQAGRQGATDDCVSCVGNAQPVAAQRAGKGLRGEFDGMAGHGA